MDQKARLHGQLKRLLQTDNQAHGGGERNSVPLCTGLHPQRYGRIRLAHARLVEQEDILPCSR
jgi:hypothetical protein